MISRRLALAFLLAALTRLVSAADDAGQVRIAIVGDSTVCDYPDDSPTRGWGQFIQGFFKDTVSVRNHAASGRSTKTFFMEKRWKKALEEKPHFVLIQFGHNDANGAGHLEATNAISDYPEYLRRFVEQARAKGAVPILVTPVHRRTFGKDGQLVDSLLPYVNVMKRVGMDKNVPVIDLYEMSGELFQRLGREKVQQLANLAADDTHFNKLGAKMMAAIVMRELPKVALSLQARLR